MNVTHDFYSKPSSMSAYPLYSTNPIRHQRGGWSGDIHDINQMRHASKKAVMNAIRFLLPPLRGIAEGIERQRKKRN